MNTLTTAIQAALASVLLASGAAKVAGAAGAERDRLDVAAWIWIVAGLVELIGAIGMILGIKVRRLAALAGLSIAGLMVGALGTHAFAGDSTAKMLPAAFVFGAASIVTAVRGIPAYTRRGARPALETGN